MIHDNNKTDKKNIFNKAPQIPEEVADTIDAIKEKGFEAYIVGGCIRDLLLNKSPKDWDVATNALPDEIEKIFPRTFCNNKYGMIGVTHEKDGVTKVVEVTTFRCDDIYSNKRHPDSVKYCKSVEEDLSRRDFTINAIAYEMNKNEFVDPSGGIGDIAQSTIRAVGDAEERISEDLLRMLRAIRIAVETGFKIDSSVEKAIVKNAKEIVKISKERVRDEFTKILMSDQPMRGLLMLNDTGLLTHIIPDLKRGIGCDQNQAHKYDVFEHNLRTLQHSADKSYPFIIRLSSLLHDIAKPHTREFSKEKNDWTFHSHEVLGAKLAKDIAEDLRYPREVVQDVRTLVRWHMFFSDTEQVTHSAVRRLVARVGEDKIWDLIKLRICDRIGTGRPKEQPYRLRKFMAMIDEVMRDPISVSMLKISGNDIMKLGEKPGPKIGFVLHALLEEALDDTGKNTEEYLINRAKELLKLPADELAKLGMSGKEKMEEEDAKIIQSIRKKRFVD